MEDVPGATIDSFQADGDVRLTIEFTIDADQATNDMTQAEFLTRTLLSDFDVSSDSNFILLNVISRLCMSQISNSQSNVSAFDIPDNFNPLCPPDHHRYPTLKG